MIKKNYQETDFVSSQENKKKYAVYEKGLPTIKCICGRRILVVPDLNAMKTAIKNHVAEHNQLDYSLAVDSLEEFLTEQILIKSSEMNLSNVS